MSTYIKRTIENTLNEMANTFPVVMITGPRQVGKTTLLNNIVKQNNEDINFVTLDNMDARKLAVEDPELFLRTYKLPLIIDEFQYAPNLLSYIKIIVDKARLESFENSKTNKKGLFYLTGSQSFQAMSNVTESLAGRVRYTKLIWTNNKRNTKKRRKLFFA